MGRTDAEAGVARRPRGPPSQPGSPALMETLRGLLAYQAADPGEEADLTRIRALIGGQPDPWRRSIPLHLTASAVIVHPGSGRILLRWHERQQAWLQVGGHADPGEHDPVVI